MQNDDTPDQGTPDHDAPDDAARPADPCATPPLRELVGDVLRTRRRERGDRLVDVATRAGISPQYLSEIERGRKDPSSEMVEAVAAALGLDLDGLLLELVRRRGLDALPEARADIIEAPVVLHVAPQPRRVGGPDLDVRCLAA